MTVNSSISSAAHVTSSLITVYDFNFKAINDDHLSIIIAFSDETAEELIWGTDYTVSGLNLDGGGSVTLSASGVTKAGDGNTLTILRDMPFLQEIDFITNGKMPSDMVELANDIATMERQQLLEMTGRALIAEPGLVIPTVAQINEAINTASGAAADVAALKPKVEANTQNIATVTSTVSGLSTAVNTNTANISWATNQIGNIVGESLLLTTKVLTLEDGMAALKTKVTANQAAIDELDADISGLSMAITENSTSIGTNKSSISDLKQRVTILEGGGGGGGGEGGGSVDLTDVYERIEGVETGLTNVSAKATSAYELASTADTNANSALTGVSSNASSITSLATRITELENKPTSTGEEIGTEKMWPATTAPEGWLDESKYLGLIPRATYPELWAVALASGNLLDDTTWVANYTANGSVPSFSTGDGATTFRIPLMRKVYIRAADTDNSVNVGDYQGDVQQSQISTGYAGGIFAQNDTNAGGTWKKAVNSTYTLSSTTGTVHALTTLTMTPLSIRTGTEVRPVTAVRLPIIKAFNVTASSGGTGTSSASKILHIQDVKDALVNGGTMTLGAWRTRDLNTIATNRIDGSSLVSNRISLPAGEYWVEAHAIGYAISYHQSRLYDVETSSTLLMGEPAYSPADNVRASLMGLITVTGTESLELQHRASSTRLDSGMGIGNPFGEQNIYSQIVIRKV